MPTKQKCRVAKKAKVRPVENERSQQVMKAKTTKATKPTKSPKPVEIVGDFFIGTNTALKRLGFGKSKLLVELADPNSDIPRPIKTNPRKGGRLQFSNDEISAYLQRRLAMRSQPNGQS